MKEIYSELKGILNTKQKIQVFIIFILSLIGGILETLSISLIIPYIGIIIEPTILLEKSWGKVFLNIFDGYSYNKILILSFFIHKNFIQGICIYNGIEKKMFHIENLCLLWNV